MPSASLPRPAGAGRAAGVLLVAHGSRHVDVGRALSEQCRLLDGELADRGRPAEVVGGFLDHADPRAEDQGMALAVQRGCREVVLAPLLLTEAYHTRNDVPALAATLQAQLEGLATVAVAPHLGQHPGLLEEARARLRHAADRGLDGVVVALTGTSDVAELDAQRRHVVDGLGDVLPPDRVAVAVLTTAGPTPQDAIHQLLQAGTGHPGWLSWSLLPGTLADAALVHARAASANLVDLGRLGPSPTVARALADRLATTHRSARP